jgi:hypothetical protein
MLLSAPRGFLGFQALFPRGSATPAFHELASKCREFGLVPLFPGFKRHIPDPAYLSFCGDGISVSIHVPLNALSEEERERFRSAFLEIILNHGGKVYLAKYPYLPVEVFRQMYPDYKKHVGIKEKHDPARLFRSNATDRLLIQDPTPLRPGS